MNDCFGKGRLPSHKINYPYRVKIPFVKFTEVNDWLDEYFGERWAARFYDSKYLPFFGDALKGPSTPWYIICFTNEEDAVYFKMSFTFVERLTRPELQYDMHREWR